MDIDTLLHVRIKHLLFAAVTHQINTAGLTKLMYQKPLPYNSFFEQIDIPMLTKLIQLLRGKKHEISHSVPGSSPSASSKAPGRRNERVAARSIVDALRQNHLRVAKSELRAWWIGVNRERIPKGDCWVIGGHFFCLDFQWPLVLAIEDMVANAPNPRIFVGRGAFWRVACQELWEAGRVDELRRRLPGVLQFYDPQVYVTWARVLVIDGRTLEAGKYFLFSGLYDASESQFVAQFKCMFARAHPNEIVGRMPGPCAKKSARRQFPPQVYEDLATIPCPDWLKRRPAEQNWTSY